MQGRIFVSLGNELVHKLDMDLAGNPHPVNFNNIGGNSLWPAPEGGEFAFNYPNGSNEWYVQEGINRTCPILKTGQGELSCVKKIPLVNRKGKHIDVVIERKVKAIVLDSDSERYDIEAVGYHSTDSMLLAEPCRTDEAVLAAWSLEQFPGCDNITAFGRVANGSASEALNLDFYGDASPRLKYSGRQFLFRLGGSERLQIGISAASMPLFIGAYDRARGLAIIRSTPCIPGGRYINIADNDQKSGVYGAQDQYSIFNGGALNFFELETIAPMRFDPNGLLTGSILESETRIYRGDAKQLKKLLKTDYDINLEEL